MLQAHRGRERIDEDGKFLAAKRRSRCSGPGNDGARRQPRRLFERKKEKGRSEPTATLTPTPTPTPEVHVWNFDSDKAGEVAAGWKAVEGDWQVIPDPSAPSKPNTFGLPAGRLLKSLTSALEYYPIAIQTDPTEYADFTLEAQFKSAGGRFDCSGGIIFRYVDDKNFYLLSAGCPSDYFALSRMTNGQLSA